MSGLARAHVSTSWFENRSRCKGRRSPKCQDSDRSSRGPAAACSASNKIDYVLLSPALFAKATGGQIFRMGVWGGTNGTLFPHFPEITKSIEAASDHAAITAEIDL